MPTQIHQNPPPFSIANYSLLITVKKAALSFSPTRLTKLKQAWLCVRSVVDYSLAKPFTFSTKEKDSETSLSYFSSRYYNSDLSIWLSVDPMASKYPSFSPYVYCANNPVKLVDPNGEEIFIIGENGNEITYTQGMKYSGNDRFTKKTVQALNKLYESKSNTGRSMIDKLVKSENKFKIQIQDTKKKTNSDFTPDNYIGAQIGVKHRAEELKEFGINYSGNKGSGGTINWNSSSCRVMTSKGLRNSPFFGLVHELSHALDADNGIMDYSEVAGMTINEWQSCANTNIIRT